jgi:hypothetical protein
MWIQKCFHWVFNNVIFVTYKIYPLFEELQVFYFPNMIKYKVSTYYYYNTYLINLGLYKSSKMPKQNL